MCNFLSSCAYDELIYFMRLWAARDVTLFPMFEDPVTMTSRKPNRVLPGAKLLHIDQPFELEFGGVLPELHIAYETLGTLNEAKDNAIFVCPAFSAHSHIRSHEGDPTPGWWERIVGPGLAFDTNQYFVICASLLGSCYGTTGPTCTNPETGEPYAASFPVFTTRDMVNVHQKLLDHLEIDQLHTLVGGSLGAMQVLEWAIQHPSRMRRVIAISGTDHTRPYTAAIRHIGRRAIMLDPEYKDGNYGDQWPLRGLRLARELGTLFYRSRSEFNRRFNWKPLRAPSLHDATFDVQSYLNHQGNKIVSRFDPNSYLFLSLCLDLHDVTRGFPSSEDAYKRITAEMLVMGVREDHLIPVDEQKLLYLVLSDAGATSHWREISSPIGHDAFLVEFDLLTPIFRNFLDPSYNTYAEGGVGRM